MMRSPLQMRAPSWLFSSPDAMLRIVLPSALMTWLRLPSGPRLERPSFADGAFGRLGSLCLFARNFQSLVWRGSIIFGLKIVALKSATHRETTPKLQRSTVPLLRRAPCGIMGAHSSKLGGAERRQDNCILS